MRDPGWLVWPSGARLRWMVTARSARAGAGKVDRVGPVFGAGRDDHSRAAVEGQGAIGSRPDPGRAGAHGQGEVGRIDREWRMAKGVGQTHPETPPADRERNRLSQSGVGQVGARQGVLRLRLLLRRRPGGDPARLPDRLAVSRRAPARAATAIARATARAGRRDLPWVAGCGLGGCADDPRTSPGGRSTSANDGGEGGIRTPDTLASMPHFECGAFNHSATSPYRGRARARNLATNPGLRKCGASPT